MFKGLCNFIEGSFSVSHHLAKFGGYRRCGSRDITDLLFHVAFQDPVIKGTWDLMEGSYSLYIPTLPKLVAIDILVLHI